MVAEMSTPSIHLRQHPDTGLNDELKYYKSMWNHTSRLLTWLPKYSEQQVQTWSMKADEPRTEDNLSQQGQAGDRDHQ